MAVVYYNPLMFLYWYDKPEKYAYGAWPALRWLDESPTAWHETQVIGGEPGEHVAVARRNGTRWFLGAMTNENAPNLNVPLGFLGEGRWRATFFADGVPGEEARMTPVIVTSQEPGSRDSISVSMQPCGGQAVLFEPMPS